MLKYILILGINVFLLNAAKSQTLDTTITYYKFNLLGTQKVMTRDSADFIRVVFPSTDVDADLTVNEFYKNGRTKLIGKYDHVYYNDKWNKYGQLVGSCITYFPNGKRKATMTYAEGLIVGDEYQFYPDGKIYCYIKHNWSGRRFNVPVVLNWECYDDNGVKICSEGNGKWLMYNDNFNLVISGMVKNGLSEGDWQGATMQADSIKYIYKYHNGLFVSGIGFDKSGKAYPFQKDVVQPTYKVSKSSHEVSPVIFVSILRKNLHVPIDANGNKISLDTAHISFTLEKDGSITNGEVLGNTDPVLKEALKNALDKVSGWSPRTYFGIPLRSRITVPYKELSQMEGSLYVRKIQFKEFIYKDY